MTAWQTDRTGGYAWPGGVRLARLLGELADCTGCRVVDLGCGQGVLAQAALAHGAREVLCLDGASAALAGAQAALGHDPRAAVARYEWGQPHAFGRFDVVLGGDVLYRPECHAQLLTSIQLLLADQGLALLGDPRQRLEEELPELARSLGLSWTALPAADLSVVRLRHAAAVEPTGCRDMQQ